MPDEPNTKTLARGGTIHPIETAPIRDGERFGDVLLSPGIDHQWENGYRDPITGSWFRRDHVLLNPTHWSPLPGQTYLLDMD